MKKVEINSGRRTVLKGLAAIPVVGSAVLGVAHAAERLDPDSAAAAALRYTHESGKSGQTCANCRLWLSGEAVWGDCSIFPGKEVSAVGWCTAWVPKG